MNPRLPDPQVCVLTPLLLYGREEQPPLPPVSENDSIIAASGTAKDNGRHSHTSREETWEQLRVGGQEDPKHCGTCCQDWAGSVTQQRMPG